MAHGKVVEYVDELVGQMLLHHEIGRGGEANHVRGEEGGDDGHGNDHRIEEVADDT